LFGYYYIDTGRRDSRDYYTKEKKPEYSFNLNIVTFDI